MFHWLSHSHRRVRVNVLNQVPLDERSLRVLRRAGASLTFVLTATEDNRPVITLSGEEFGTEVLWESQQQYPTKYDARGAGYAHLRAALRSLLQAEVRA